MATFAIRDNTGRLLFSVESDTPVASANALYDMDKSIESAFAEATKYCNAVEVMSVEAGFGDNVKAVAIKVKDKLVAFFKKIVEFCQYLITNLSTKNQQIKNLSKNIYEKSKEALKNLNSADEEQLKEYKETMAATSAGRKALMLMIKQEKAAAANPDYVWGKVWTSTDVERNLVYQFALQGAPNRGAIEGILKNMEADMEKFNEANAAKKAADKAAKKAPAGDAQ